MSGVCVLMSGGVESMTLLSRELREGRVPHALYIESGLAWEEAERKAVSLFMEESVFDVEFRVVSASLSDVYPGHWSVTGNDVPDMESDDEEVYIPGRNVVLMSKAAVYCSVYNLDEIWHGALSGNPFPDSTERFFTEMENAVSTGLDHEISIKAPLSGYEKHEVISIAQDLGVPLRHTFSCISPVDGGHCGECNKCRERIEAFSAAEIPDPTMYKSHVV